MGWLDWVRALGTRTHVEPSPTEGQAHGFDPLRRPTRFGSRGGLKGTINGRERVVPGLDAQGSATRTHQAQILPHTGAPTLQIHLGTTLK